MPAVLHHSRLRSAACAVLAMAALLLIAGCSSPSPTGPLPTPAGGAVLGGSVRDTAGQPVGGVMITAEPVDGGLAASVRARMEDAARGGASAAAVAAKAQATVRTTVTDQDGWFAFAGLEPGTWIVTTEARDHKAGTASATLPDRRAAALAETTFVDIALVPTGTFFGHTALENMDSYANTFVYCEGTSYVAVTSANGEFALLDVPAGTYTLVATHAGWLDASTQGSLAQAGEMVEIDRLTLLRDNNIAPVVTITEPVDGGNSSRLQGRFRADTRDPDGTIVLYEWDFEDDGIFDFVSMTSAAVDRAWPSTGARRAKLRLTDNRGAMTLAAVNFTVVEDVYVSQANGSDTNPGTRAAPVATVMHGLEMASSEGKHLVMVGLGTYTEDVVLRDGISVIGGLSEPSWTRSTSSRSDVAAVSPAVRQDGVVGAAFTGLNFWAADATMPGAPSIGLWLVSCLDLRFDDCTFNGGAGASGLTGTGGSPGPGGVSGATGYNGSSGGQGAPGAFDLSAPGDTRGMHGSTGGYGVTGGTSGTIGYPLGIGQAGAGGLGAVCGSPAGNAGSGGPGDNGTGGSHGNGSPAIVGTTTDGAWVAATGGAGTAGSYGFGGGGGGGGGGGLTAVNCQPERGGGGGGGGSGGHGGGGATGGGGGGASLAVLLVDSSPTFATVCRFTSRPGGAGGNGGAGGSGGVGGVGGGGGFGQGSSGRGGEAGDGGNGGGGGGGQGGPGGPSICLYKAGTSSPVLVGSHMMFVGTAGAGGSGGLRGGTTDAAPAGPGGAAQAIYP